MAILDHALKMATSVAVTDAALQLGDVVDLKKGGDGLSNNPLWYVQVDEAATAAAGADVTFELQTSDDEEFTSYKTLVSSGPLAKATLTANAIAVEMQIPSNGCLRYLRVYATPSATLTAGKFSSVIGY